MDTPGDTKLQIETFRSEILSEMATLKSENAKILSEMEQLKSEMAALTARNDSIVSNASEFGDGVIKFEAYKKGVKISGDTKQYKDTLKKAGGKWNGTLKSWIMTIAASQLLIPKMTEKYGDKILSDVEEYEI